MQRPSTRTGASDLTTTIQNVALNRLPIYGESGVLDAYNQSGGRTHFRVNNEGQLEYWRSNATKHTPFGLIKLKAKFKPVVQSFADGQWPVNGQVTALIPSAKGGALALINGQLFQLSVDGTAQPWKPANVLGNGRITDAFTRQGAVYFVLDNATVYKGSPDNNQSISRVSEPNVADSLAAGERLFFDNKGVWWKFQQNELARFNPVTKQWQRVSPSAEGVDAYQSVTISETGQVFGFYQDDNQPVQENVRTGQRVDPAFSTRQIDARLNDAFTFAAIGANGQQIILGVGRSQAGELTGYIEAAGTGKDQPAQRLPVIFPDGQPVTGIQRLRAGIDGKIYYVQKGKVYSTAVENGRWTTPQEINSGSTLNALDVAVDNDGKTAILLADGTLVGANRAELQVTTDGAAGKLTQIAYDNDGLLWAITDQGALFKYNANGEQLFSSLDAAESTGTVIPKFEQLSTAAKDGLIRVVDESGKGYFIGSSIESRELPSALAASQAPNLPGKGQVVRVPGGRWTETFLGLLPLGHTVSGKTKNFATILFKEKLNRNILNSIGDYFSAHIKTPVQKGAKGLWRIIQNAAQTEGPILTQGGSGRVYQELNQFVANSAQYFEGKQKVTLITSDSSTQSIIAENAKIVSEIKQLINYDELTRPENGSFLNKIKSEVKRVRKTEAFDANNLIFQLAESPVLDQSTRQFMQELLDLGAFIDAKSPGAVLQAKLLQNADTLRRIHENEPVDTTAINDSAISKAYAQGFRSLPEMYNLEKAVKGLSGDLQNPDSELSKAWREVTGVEKAAGQEALVTAIKNKIAALPVGESLTLSRSRGVEVSLTGKRAISRAVGPASVTLYAGPKGHWKVAPSLTLSKKADGSLGLSISYSRDAGGGVGTEFIAGGGISGGLSVSGVLGAGIVGNQVRMATFSTTISGQNNFINQLTGGDLSLTGIRSQAVGQGTVNRKTVVGVSASAYVNAGVNAPALAVLEDTPAKAQFNFSAKPVRGEGAINVNRASSETTGANGVEGANNSNSRNVSVGYGIMPFYSGVVFGQQDADKFRPLEPYYKKIRTLTVLSDNLSINLSFETDTVLGNSAQRVKAVTVSESLNPSALATGKLQDVTTRLQGLLGRNPEDAALNTAVNKVLEAATKQGGNLSLSYELTAEGVRQFNQEGNGQQWLQRIHQESLQNTNAHTDVLRIKSVSLGSSASHATSGGAVIVAGVVSSGSISESVSLGSVSFKYDSSSNQPSLDKSAGALFVDGVSGVTPDVNPGDNYRDQVKAVIDRLGLTNQINEAELTELVKLADRVSGIDADQFTALREKYPNLSDAQLLEKAAFEGLQKSVTGIEGAEELVSVAGWTEQDANQYLTETGIRLNGTTSGFDVAAVERIVNNGNTQDRLKLVTALTKIDATPLLAELKKSTNPAVRDLATAVKQNTGSSVGGNVLNGGNHAFNAFQTLNSVRQIVSDWDQLTTRDKAFALTELVGGVALPTVVSKAVSEAFKAAGHALGTVGKAVKGGVLDLILAPVSLTAIGLQWQDFWNKNGDTGSIEYKSLVANTVITSVTLAASVALTGVSIAAAVSATVAGTTVAAAAAAGSTLAAVAAAAGPIGIAIGVAAFVVNGIVQGALQLAEYDEHFDNVGDKVHQFFAAWIGIETEGLKKARARKQGAEAASATEASLLEQWNETKTFLSDLFAKNGYKYLNVRDRDYQVNYGAVDVNGEYGFLLQQETRYGELARVYSTLIDNGNTVWAELGKKSDAIIAGDIDKKNLFNLDDNTELNQVYGGDQADVFNLTANTSVNKIDGASQRGEGAEAETDTLVWSGNNYDSDIEINTITGTARDKRTNKQFSIDNIENFSINNASHVTIRGGDEDNVLDAEASNSSQLYGGGGKNTFVLNNNTVAHSESNDVFLWKQGVSAKIELQAGATSTQGSSRSNQTQVAFIELPIHYGKVKAHRENSALVLIVPGQHQLTINNVFSADGRLQKNKVLQLKDRAGQVFSLNLTDNMPNHQQKSLTQISKSFVFGSINGQAENNRPQFLFGPRFLYGDSAVTNYRFREGSGHFIIEPRTQRLMSLMLDTNLGEIQYSYQGTTLILSQQKAGKTLKIELRNYQQYQGQLQFYTFNSVGNNRELVLLNLPEQGSGTLNETHLAEGSQQAQQVTNTILQKVRLLAGENINLSQSTNSQHSIISVNQANEINIAVSDKRQLAFIRYGDDLLLYDNNKLDRTYGLQATHHLRIEGYFSSVISRRPGLNINGQILSGQIVENFAESYLGTTKNDQLSGAEYSHLAGANGNDTYRVDLTATQQKSYTIDNYAADTEGDLLILDNVADPNDLQFSLQGTDLIISHQQAQVILKNYQLNNEYRHLRLRTQKGTNYSFDYTIPTVGANGYYVYELDANQNQRVRFFNSDKSHFVHIPAGSHEIGTIELKSNIATYKKEVYGEDLKLTAADGQQTIYIKNYYAHPSAIDFAWGDNKPQRGSQTTYYHETVLPDGEYQALLDIGVEKQFVVRYVNAGADTVEEASKVLAHKQNKFLQKVATNQYGEQFLPAGHEVISAFVDVNNTPFFGGNADNLFSTRSDRDTEGFRFHINNQGDLVLDVSNNRYGKVHDDLLIKRGAFSRGERTSLLFTYDPDGYQLTIWKKGQRTPIVSTQLDPYFETARTEATRVTSSRGITLFHGDPADFIDNIGDALNNRVNGLTTSFSAEVAKQRYRIEGINDLSETLLSELVDQQHLVSVEQVNDAIAYLNKGIKNAALIKQLSDDLRNTPFVQDASYRANIQPNTIDVAYVNALFAQGAGDDFVFAALVEKLDYFSAQQYLAAQVDASDIATVKGLVGEYSASNSLSLVKKALQIAGYHPNAAESVAAVMAEYGIASYTEVEAFFRIQVTDGAAIKHYLDAGVTAGDLVQGDKIHQQYRAGNRSRLINVSVSQNLTTRNSSDRYFAKQSVDGGRIQQGEVLHTAAAETLANQNGVVSRLNGGTTDSWFGKSNPNHLVDGFAHNRESTAWATAEENVTVNGNTWIQFDLTDKVALTHLVLTSEGGNGSNLRFKAQAKDTQGNWVDVSTEFNWQPQADHQTYQVNLDTNGLPYQQYRLVGVSGDFAKELWLKEVEFGTQALISPNQTAGALQLNDQGNDSYLSSREFALGGANQFTVEARFASDRQQLNTNDYVPIVSYASPGSTNELLLGVHPGGLNIWIKAKQYTTSVTAEELLDGNYHQVAITRNSDGKLDIYVDGQLRDSVDTDGQALANTDQGLLVIGQEQDTRVGEGFDPNQTFQGKYDDIKFYNRALSAAEVNNPAIRNQQSLVSHWTFDQLENNEVVDATGSGYDLQLQRVTGEGFNQAVHPNEIAATNTDQLVQSMASFGAEERVSSIPVNGQVNTVANPVLVATSS